MEETAKDVMQHLEVLSNLPKDATKQKAKKAEELKALEVKYGTQTNDLLTQNYEGGGCGSLRSSGRKNGVWCIFKTDG